ncbi:MAG: SRPBCC domain-containing protein [Bacteroidetes bacterium]|nr:MAG: SRPBCC domain-containing protein [Bacteroidota bacterium]
MKNFDWSSFSRKIALKGTVQLIYNAWTKSSELEKWFLKTALFYTNDDHLIGPKDSIAKGMHYKWTWYLYEGIGEGKITETNGKDLIQFTFAGECLVDVSLVQQAEYVIVKITQKNIPTDDESKKSIRLGCDSGWSFYLLNLKSFYESGVDLRNKNPDLKGMVNN